MLSADTVAEIHQDYARAGADAHAARLADLPARRDLNTVRAEFLDSFVAALLPLGVLDRFKLAGVIATWWTDTLPDFKK
jgi:type I restriction enzyme M protein